MISIFLAIQTATCAQTEVKVSENNYLKIERKQEILNSRLSEKYNGYEYNIVNKYDETVIIKNINFRDNANAQIAYLSVKKAKEDIKAEAFEKANKNSIKTLGLSYITTIAILPFKQIGNNIGNRNAQNESQEYDKKSCYEIKLEPNKNIQLKTMALKNYKPKLKLIYKNPITDENMPLEL